ncbi:hypothetical protein AMECASPLE_039086 [Ameca splendens]|uniref:Secreted protein n=1 Tax=Ameca splendens TaxID=208324 RepID=A0ABV1AEU4_9TELE
MRLSRVRVLGPATFAECLPLSLTSFLSTYCRKNEKIKASSAAEKKKKKQQQKKNLFISGWLKFLFISCWRNDNMQASGHEMGCMPFSAHQRSKTFHSAAYKAVVEVVRTPTSSTIAKLL